MSSNKTISFILCYLFFMVQIQLFGQQNDSTLVNKSFPDDSVLYFSDSTEKKHPVLNDSLSTVLRKESNAVISETKNIVIEDSSILMGNKQKKPGLGLTNNILPDSSVKKRFFYNIKEKFKLDSTTSKKIIQGLHAKTYGTINAGYDYGILPFAANIKYPMGYFNSQGNIGFSLLGLPLVATYYYSDIKNISGLNNYFRVSFDASRYKKYTTNNSLEKIQAEKEKLTSLTQIRQQFIQKMSYSQMLKNGLPSPSSLSPQLTNYKNQYNLDPYKNYDNIAILDSLTDSLGYTKPSYKDSISRINGLISKYDSLSERVDYYNGQIQKIDQQIKSINNKIQYLNHPEKIAEDNAYMRKYQAILSGIKKLDIGLCYPNYSTFLVSGSSLNGINVEWEKKFYVAFTYGKTINTVMTTNNLIQNQLQATRNLYNFFDFNNVKNSRKIAAFKIGYGKKEGTHLYAGFLYGLGLPSYVSAIPQTIVEKNLVLELDGRVNLNSSNAFELVYGKSALFQSGLSSSSDNNFPFSSYRSNAAQVKYLAEIKKTKTKVTATGRLVDPFFNSYGVGFIRSDNLRYELKIDQTIGSKVKLNGFYRKDRDNLLNMFSYTTQLQTMGATVSVKLNKQFTAKASYMPVIQNIASKDSGMAVQHRINNISNVVLAYMPRLEKFTCIFNGMYSYYNLSSSGSKGNNFQNYTFTNSLTFKQGFKNDLGCNYFQNNDSDTLNNNTLLVSDNVSYSLKGIIFTLGMKVSHNHSIQTQTGGMLKINIPVIKHIRFELMAEKLVLGDFYNSYNMTEIQRFPFYGYAKLLMNW